MVPRQIGNIGENIMLTRLVWTFAFAQIGLAPATAETVTWACSIIEDGKPQVLKYTIQDNNVVVSDWQSRIIDWADEKFRIKKHEGIRLKVVEDNTKGLIAVGDGIPTDPGEPSDYSTRMLIINKHTGAMSYLWLSTRSGPSETKGTCVN
jgi:hypothetical protein